MDFSLKYYAHGRKLLKGDLLLSEFREASLTEGVDDTAYSFAV